MKHLHIQARLTIFEGKNSTEGTYGKGIATLMRGVSEYGSLNSAAKHIHMAYSKAWRIVKEAETAFGFDLIDRDGARGSTLTPEGEKLLETYEQLEVEVQELLDKRFVDLTKQK
jgi:molybdate transport system regulatory protein